MAKVEPTEFNQSHLSAFEVHPNNCSLVNNAPHTDESSVLSDGGIWGRLTVTLFSLMVSGSLLASYSPSSFYFGIVYIASTSLRPIFLFSSWTGWIYETTNPDPIFKVIECCYIKRHEEDLVGEEEAYRILQEIIRSPELFKALTGSCLRGAADPALDKLDDKQKKKLETLNKLEQKGFEVKELKDNMTGGGVTRDGDNLQHMD